MLTISYEEFIKKFPNLLKLDNEMPKNIKITTITSIYHYDIIIDPQYISDNIPLDKNFIENIKYGENKILEKKGLNFYRTINKDEETLKRKNHSINIKKYVQHNNLYKQTRLGINIKQYDINFKLKMFKNGTIQTTGSKNIISVFYVFYNLFELLKKDKNYLESGYENLDIRKIKYFTCSLINCKLHLGFHVDRLNLYKLLKEKTGMLVKFDPSRHAAISLKFNQLEEDKNIISKYKVRYLTIFLFERGTILINGANCYKDLIIAYKFIMNIILTNKQIMV